MFPNIFLSMKNKTMLPKVLWTYDFSLDDLTLNLGTQMVEAWRMEAKTLPLSCGEL